MKLLVWSQYFWPESFQINDVVAALAATGHEVTVLTGKPNYPSGEIVKGYRAAGVEEDVFSGADVKRVPLIPRGPGGGLRLALNYLSFIASGYFRAPAVLQRRNFDAVFVFAPSPLLQALPALAFARRRKVPLALWVQDLWPEALAATGFVQNRVLLWLVEQLVRRIYRRSDLILIQSEAFRASVCRLAGDPEKVHFLPNSAAEPDLSSPCSNEARHVADAMKRCFAVTFTGNVGQAQAMETVLAAAEAIAHLKDIKFFVVGAGSRAIWMKSEIERRHLANVFMVGHLPKTDMPALMEASSALLLTLGSGAVGAYTVPSKLQAYLAAGKPVVASVDGETARIINIAEAGIACGAEDGRGLADAIKKVHALTPAERDRMGQNGRTFFLEHYSLKHLVTDLTSHLNRLQQLHGSSHE